MGSLGQVIRRWLDERFGLDSLLQFAKKKTVPVHRHSVWYYLGGMTVFLFVIQVLTGILLLDRKSTRLNSSHIQKSRMPSSA